MRTATTVLPCGCVASGPAGALARCRKGCADMTPDHVRRRQGGR